MTQTTFLIYGKRGAFNSGCLPAPHHRKWWSARPVRTSKLAPGRSSRRRVTSYSPALPGALTGGSFLIANQGLEFCVTPSKHTDLKISNREYIAVFQFGFSLVSLPTAHTAIQNRICPVHRPKVAKWNPLPHHGFLSIRINSSTNYGGS